MDTAGTMLIVGFVVLSGLMGFMLYGESAETTERNKYVSAAIANGVDPLIARCAFDQKGN